MSDASERANGQANGPVLTTRFLVILNHRLWHSAAVKLWDIFKQCPQSSSLIITLSGPSSIESDVLDLPSDSDMFLGKPYARSPQETKASLSYGLN